MTACEPALNEAGVFDAFPWWDERDVLTYITPTRFGYISSVAGALQGQRVLDLGCGGGLLAEPLAREGARVTGIDVSENALHVAREHARQSGLPSEYMLSPAEALPFADGSFDTVIAFDVLEHVCDLAAAVKEASRVLRPGGKLVYDTVNRTLASLVVIVLIGEHLWRGGPPKGTHRWRKFIKSEELVCLLAEHGVANVETIGFVPTGVDLRGRLVMGYSTFKCLSYVGYGIKRG